jgi:hypothetical protein
MSKHSSESDDTFEIPRTKQQETIDDDDTGIETLDATQHARHQSNSASSVEVDAPSNSEQGNNDQAVVNNDQAVVNNDQALVNNDQAQGSNTQMAEIEGERFEYGGNSATLGSRWEAWIERFQIYVDANGWHATDDAKRIKANFLRLMGTEAYEFYKVRRKEDNSDTIEEIKTFMAAQYVVPKCKYSEIVPFRKAFRHEGEPVNDYVMRLRSLARHCSFGAGLEDEIERQFVIGCNMPRVQTKCTMTPELTLAKVLKIATDHENSITSMQELSTPTRAQNTINFTTQNPTKDRWTKDDQRKNERPQSGGKDNCSSCGYAKHGDGGQCPAKGNTCHKCGKPNHFSRVCRSTVQKTSGKVRYEADKTRRGNSTFKKDNRINAVSKEPTDEKLPMDASPSDYIRVDGPEYANFVRYQQALSYTCNAITTEQSVSHVQTSASPRAIVIIHESPVDMMIDTGSPVNIIDELTYQRLQPQPALEKCNTNFFGYTATTPMEVLGQFVAKVQSTDHAAAGGFIVVKGQHECLLSCVTAKRLGLVTINRDQCDATQVRAINTKEDDDEWPVSKLKGTFPSLFSGKLGCLKNVSIKLDVDPTVKPVCQKFRQVPIHLQDAVTREINKQVEEGILEKVTLDSGPTPWVSNLVVVPKDKQNRNAKCGPSRPPSSQVPVTLAVRLTCDSRAVNEAIRRTRYPGKSIEDLVYGVNGAKWFSKLDITKAFHQIKIDPSSKIYTTITTHIGLYQYLRLHMGIAGASEMFTEAIRVLLQDLTGQINMTDDILVHGETKKAHQQNLLAVLTRLEEAGITLNIDKCQFYRRELTFFGLRFTADGISPTEDRCKALQDAKRPENIKELHSFLCTVLYSARFIKDLVTITEPLWRLTRGNEEWRWGDVEQSAFDRLKTAISTDCMAYFDKTWDTEVVVDASPIGLGAVLGQSDPNDPSKRRIVCFASRLLTDVEKRYSQCEKEALAAIWGCERFALYLFGRSFNLVTDNRAIQMILSNTKSKPPARIERMALRLDQFDYRVQHRPGNTNVADYYSRHPCSGPSVTAFLEELRTERYVNAIALSAVPDAMSIEQVIQATQSDAEMQRLSQAIWKCRDGYKLPCELAQYKRVFDELCVSPDGLVMRGDRIVIPQGMREHVVALAHVGHQGVVKTKAYIRSRVWFPGIDALVEKRIQRCHQCQTTNQKTSFEPLCPSPMPKSAWHDVAGDFYGPMADGRYWFVNHCEYSRWASVDQITATSFELVKPVLEQLFVTFGVPVVYKTDNGPPFQSYEFVNFAKRWGFKHRKITPMWPRANAEVESFMKKLGKVVRSATTSGKSRAEELQQFLVAYRATPHSTTKIPPAVLMLNRPYRVGIPEATRSLDMQALQGLAEANDAKAKEAMKREYDARMRARECCLAVGDLVLVQQPKVRKSTTRWDPSPYVIEGISGSMITATRHGHTITRNSSHFKLYWPDCDDHEAGSSAEVEEAARVDYEGSAQSQAGVPSPAGARAVQPTSSVLIAEPPGRPTKERSVELARLRQAAYERRIQENPPQRQSSRIRIQMEGKM